MKFTALGGGIPLGGSHHLLDFEDEGMRLAVDYGAIQNQGGKVSPPPIVEGHIDALLLTHGHFDHVGMLPLFGKMHPEAPVYGTEVTRRFAGMLLWDSLEITRKKIEAGENVQAYFNTADAVWVLARHERFNQVLRPEWFELKPGWKVRFWPAGHINGAASPQIITPTGLKVMHSGDISFNNMPTISGAKIAQDFRPDVLITEATYGDRDLPNRAQEEQRFIDRVIEVLQRGGRVLVPTFGVAGPNIGIILARGLAEAAKAGVKLPTIDVHMDGMLKKAARIIYGSSEWNTDNKAVPFPDNLICMPDGAAGYAYRDELLNGPAVILSSHGMAEGGKVMEYLLIVLPNARDAVLIPGHQVEGTGGRKLLELERGSNFLIPAFGRRPAQFIPRYCDVERFYLSSHASGNEITDWAMELQPKIVIVIHAPKSGHEGLKRKIFERNPAIQVAGAFNGQPLTIARSVDGALRLV